MKSANRVIGALAEEMAVELLRDKNYIIVDRNVNFKKLGELDIIALDGNTLVVVEVKYKSNKEYGHPLEAITKPKIRNIVRCTELYLSRCTVKYSQVRFDAIALTEDSTEHYIDAFGAN